MSTTTHLHALTIKSYFWVEEGQYSRLNALLSQLPSASSILNSQFPEDDGRSFSRAREFPAHDACTIQKAPQMTLTYDL